MKSTSNNYLHYSTESPTNEYIDPYRVHKSQPSDLSIGSGQEVLHSRTASDSSTTRLNTVVPTAQNLTSTIHDDPYAKTRTINNNTNTNTNTTNNINNNNNSNNNINSNIQNNNINNHNNPITYQRANSYLPYSHHRHDPQKSLATIYVEDDNTHMQGIGSMLHDNLSVDMSQQNEPRQTSPKSIDPEKYIMNQMLRKQKNKKRKCCGLYLQTWMILLGIFIPALTLLLYFLVPRFPEITFSGVDASTNIIINDEVKVTAAWTVNLTVNNNPNWIRHAIQGLDVQIADQDTNDVFGRGHLGYTTLDPRSSGQLLVVDFNVNYTKQRQNDETLLDLASACNTLRIVLPSPSQKNYLNITVIMDIYMAGLAWPSRQITNETISCPSL
ncbi:hypothetical protein BJ944DRAFT_263552 [Cunninghamella echinulata]|nr:hypothetical protein BJ944DRAFT_263552 [Cunninghamella echinulata]